MKKFNAKAATKRIRQLILVVVVLGMIALIYAMVKKQKYDQTQAVAIKIQALTDGSYLMNEDDVHQIIINSFGHGMNGQSIEDVDVARLERVLKASEFVLDAEVYMDAKDQLHIEIQQRQPLLRIIPPEGGQYYLDVHGKKMSPSRLISARVMVVTGKIAPFTADYTKKKRHVLNDIYQLAKHIHEDVFLRALVEQIYIDSKKEFTIVPKIGKQKILIGNTKALNEKFERLKVFYNEGMPYMGWNKYKTINLKFDGQVVCEKR